MLRFATFALTVLAAGTAWISVVWVSVAWATGEPPVGGKPYAEQTDPSNDRFIAELKRRIEGQGYREVEVVPQMFVVIARDGKGRKVPLVVDSNTLQAIHIGPNDTDSSSCRSKSDL
jgi:hypothetical protein